MYYGAAYYPEHREESKWEHDLDLMAQAGVNCLRVGEFAWVLFEPREGEYDFGWLERFAKLAHEREIKLLLCPPLRTVPAWLVEKDRTILIEDSEGDRLEFGSRYCFCVNHPLLLEKGEMIAREMVQRFADNPVVAGWHLDNEHGDEPDCHCPVCTEKFQKWCEAKYKTIEELDKAWGLVFWGLCLQSFSQVMTPRKSKTFQSPGHDLDWRRFRSESTIKAVKMQADTVRKFAGSGQFVTTNNQIWNTRTDYFDMAGHLDITGTNYYPSFGPNMRQNAIGLANTRCYKQDAGRFQVHELRCGAHLIPGENGCTPAKGEIAKLAMHTIANGARGIFYFRWRACPFGCEQHHGTITGYDGQPLSIYPEVKKIGEWIRRYDNLLERSAIKSDVAVMYDFPTRWVMDTGVKWNGPDGIYMEQCQRIYSAISGLGYNCDTVNAEGDFSGYKVLIVPALSAMSDEVAQKLVTFVQNGGALVWHPLSGMKDENAHVYPQRLHPDLCAMLGVDINNFITLGKNDVSDFVYAGKTHSGQLMCDAAELLCENADVVSAYVNGNCEGKVALCQRKVGKGVCWYLTTFADEAFYHSFFADMLPAAGLSLPIAKLPPEVEMRTQYGDSFKLVYLINHSHSPVVVDLGGEWHDIYNDCFGSGAMEIEKDGCAVIKIDV